MIIFQKRLKGEPTENSYSHITNSTTQALVHKANCPDNQVEKHPHCYTTLCYSIHMISRMKRVIPNLIIIECQYLTQI